MPNNYSNMVAKITARKGRSWKRLKMRTCIQLKWIS